MDKIRAAVSAAKNASEHDRPITPWLGLRSRMSQVWINRWTILLLLVLFRLVIACSSVGDGLQQSRRQALSACSNVESMGSAMASMPHYMAAGTNAMAAHGIEKAINGLGTMLLLTVTGVEELVVFVFNVLTSTYLCLITLAIRGSLHVALGLIEDVADFLNKTLGDIGQDIHKGIDAFQDDLNKVVGGLNKVGNFFGSDSQIPTLNIDGDLNKLDHLQLPSGLDADLQKLNASIPTFGQVKNFTDNAIRFPFEELKKLLNASLPHYTMDSSIFPVPAKEQVSFCSDNGGINGFFDSLNDIKETGRKVAVSVLAILAILVMIPMGYYEYRRYKSTRERAEILRELSDDPMDTLYIASRPFTAVSGIFIAQPFKSSKKHTLVRWIVAYVTTPQALFVLSLGLAGLFSCACQWLILKTLVKEIPQLTNQVAGFSNVVVSKLDNASVQWSNQTNEIMIAKNAEINHQIFGWVNTSTSALNNSLNVFVDEMSDALNATFGGTILYDPIKDVLNCLIGLKIEGIQKGLTWVQNHAHVDFPLFPNTTFSEGASKAISNDNGSDTFLADPSGGTEDAITRAVTWVTDRWLKSIETEALISGIVVIFWLIVLLMGITRAAYLAFFAKEEDAIIWERRQMPNSGSDSDKWGLTEKQAMSAKVSDVPPLVIPQPINPPPGAATRGVRPRDTRLSRRFSGQDYTISPRPFPFLAQSQTVKSPDGYAGAREVSGAMRGNAQTRASMHPTLRGTNPEDGTGRF